MCNHTMTEIAKQLVYPNMCNTVAIYARYFVCFQFSHTWYVYCDRSGVLCRSLLKFWVYMVQFKVIIIDIYATMHSVYSHIISDYFRFVKKKSIHYFEKRKIILINFHISSQKYNILVKNNLRRYFKYFTPSALIL